MQPALVPRALSVERGSPPAHVACRADPPAPRCSQSCARPAPHAGIPLMTARVRLAKGASVGPALRRLEEVCARHGIRHCTIQPEQPA